ncbi:MAG: ATP-binding protein [Planctomycetota bacterium]|nr:ATP-binding protein [Planctomycetota bacterium]
MKHNARDLNLAFDWLRKVVVACLNKQHRQAEVSEFISLELYGEDSKLTWFAATQELTYGEFMVLMLAMVPHIKPGFFGEIIAEHLPAGGEFPEFGGVKVSNHRGILPTGETAQFILAGDDLEKRLKVQRMLGSEHWFAQKHILWLDAVREGEPVMSGRLILDPETVEQLTIGTVSKPRFSIDFPAEYIETEMSWDDLVLHPNTLGQIQEIENWIKHNDTLLQEWGMKKKIKPGYRALFYGPPGTGKTLTATLLGKHTGKDVFRIDLSRVVSKYIGETEKNLSRLFDKAENKNWILFFDEADALFGKRTDIRDAHDKYANQEVAYLLQRVEGFSGLVILATNQRGNIDDAFVRRFQTIIQFPMPRPEERYEIWRKAFPPQMEIAKDIDWQQVANRFELTGAGIMNVTHYCAVEALADQSRCLDLKRLEAAILREYVKEGKIV